MAMTLSFNAAEVMLGALATLCNGALVRIYSGIAPSTVASPLDGIGNVLLAQATLGNPAFSPTFGQSGNNRVMTAEAIAPDSSANASGTATFFRIVLPDGNTPILQGSVGLSGADMAMPTVDIVVTGTVSISAMTILLPMA